MSAKSTRATAPRRKTPTRHRILVVEDHPLMREGIIKWLDHEAGVEVCGEAGSAAEAIQAVETLKPALVLVDITLPGRSGLELLRDIKALKPDLPAVVLSMHDESVYALRAIRAGARGYVTKQAGGKELVAAIKTVLEGGTAFSPEVTEQLIDQVSGRRLGHQSSLAVLTDREFEIFQLLGEGKTNQEIASQLHLSPKTVETHRINIRLKLKIKSTPELIRYAVQHTERESMEE